MPNDTRTCPVCGDDISHLRKDARVCRAQKCRNAVRGVLPRRWTRVEERRCSVVENGVQCPNTATRRLTTDVWCGKHAARAARNGTPQVVKAVRRPHGEVQALLREAARHDGNGCFMLPGPGGGRLSVSYQGKAMTAARAVWTIREGNPGDAHVLHTCHRGDEGCVSGGHLYLGDHEQNMVDMMESGRSTHGERAVHAKLSEDQVREICRRARSGELQRALAAEYGISPSHVSNIARGKTWWRVTTMHP